jgi:ubiquinol-cytochrome c reductase cytochrome b subunit
VSESRPLRALLAEWVFDKKVPAGVGFLRALGTALAVVLVTQAVTGMLLALCYVPSPDHAYESIRYVDEDLVAAVGSRSFHVGRLLRGLHHWGASSVVVLALLHLARVYFTGAYKRPRALLWVLGVAIFGVVLAFGFTGYLLPWDMKAFWATQVGLNIVQTAPGVGPKLADLLRGGPELGAPTLTRMFALHVLFLPALLVPLAGLHLLLVHKLGITPPGARVGEPETKSAPFFPDHVVRELLVAAVVLAGVAALAHWVGPPLEAPANRDATGYEPRPEWYFLGLFQLLKVFPGRLVVVATAIVPGGLALLALLLPWIDRSRERAPSRRPVAVTVGIVVLATVAALTVAGAYDAPHSESKPPLRLPVGDGSYVPPSSPPISPPSKPDDPTAAKNGAKSDDPARAALLAEGHKLVEKYECLGCHTLHGEGNTSGGGAPEFAGLVKDHDAAWVALYLLDPKKFKPDVDMQNAADFGMNDADRAKLAEWVHAMASEKP